MCRFQGCRRPGLKAAPRAKARKAEPGPWPPRSAGLVGGTERERGPADAHTLTHVLSSLAVGTEICNGGPVPKSSTCCIL